MKKISVSEFRSYIGEYLDRATGGEELILTRYGSAIAKLGPPSCGEETSDISLGAMRELRARQLPASWSELKAMRDKGRR